MCLQTTNRELYDLTGSRTDVSHTATLATALYNVVWDLYKCPSGSRSSSYFLAAAFSFTQSLFFWPTARLSQMGRITVIPAWCQVGDIDSHQVLRIGLLVGSKEEALGMKSRGCRLNLLINAIACPQRMLFT